jgi:HK97 family phage major capsid protein
VIALWGLPLVVSAALAAGTGVVGAFRRGGAIYRKRTYRVDMSNSHSDFFIKNLVAIRAEVRELLAVFKPESFASVTNLGVVA